jgi:NitT/TauT family transport system substrate-binding protein
VRAREVPARRPATRLSTLVALLGWFTVSLADTQPTQDHRFGDIGEPVVLVVGYQPYFTLTWSAAVMRAQHFAERYLPQGSKVEFQIGIKGAGVITEALRSGRQSLGYLGSAPTVRVVQSGTADGTPIRIIATTGMAHDQCNILLLRRDAPPFAAPREAIRWLGQRVFAVPYGTCAQVFALDLFTGANPPRAMFDQTPDLIRRSFALGRVDGAAVWEPFASELVDAGLARRAASGATIGRADAAFLVVRQDLLQQRPDVVQAWLHAELDAERFLADPRNRAAVVQMVQSQTTGLSAAVLDHALYGAYPSAQGGERERLRLPFDVTSDALQLLNRTAQALAQAGALSAAGLPAGAVRAELARATLGSAGPPGHILGQDIHAR